MKKISLLGLVCLCALGAAAESVNTTASYIYSSDYNQARVGASVPMGISAALGLQGRYVEDKKETGIKHPVFSVYVPFELELDFARFHLTPFYYFKNKAQQPSFQDPYAYGITTQVTLNLKQDEVDELYTQAYLGASYARQKGTVQEQNWSNKTYDQTAYTLGLRQNFYGAFMFQVAGSLYQYPDGISRVRAFQGILDQNDLAFTQSYDVSRELGKYVLSARFTRMWAEQRSSLYVGYHYGEFYTAEPQHSVLVGNTFYVGPQARVDMAFNHLQTTANNNKRDLFYINLHLAF